MVGESLARQFAQKQDLTLQKKVIVAEFTISDCNSKRGTIGVVIVNTVIDRFNKHCLNNSKSNSIGHFLDGIFNSESQIKQQPASYKARQ